MWFIEGIVGVVVIIIYLNLGIFIGKHFGSFENFILAVLEKKK